MCRWSGRTGRLRGAEVRRTRRSCLGSCCGCRPVSGSGQLEDNWLFCSIITGLTSRRCRLYGCGGLMVSNFVTMNSRWPRFLDTGFDGVQLGYRVWILRKTRPDELRHSAMVPHLVKQDSRRQRCWLLQSSSHVVPEFYSLVRRSLAAGVGTADYPARCFAYLVGVPCGVNWKCGTR